MHQADAPVSEIVPRERGHASSRRSAGERSAQPVGGHLLEHAAVAWRSLVTKLAEPTARDFRGVIRVGTACAITHTWHV
jgi:hypothetical protein